MSFTFNCECCGQKLEAEDELAGEQVNCPACGKEIAVPEPQVDEDDDGDKMASLHAEKEAEQRTLAELTGKRDALQKELTADVARLKELIVTKIKLGDYESAFNFARDEYCTEEDILVFLLEISFREHNFDIALKYAEELIEKCPDSSVGYRWKAEILDDGFGEMEESIRFSTKAIELNPKDARAYAIRGNTKRWMRVLDAEGAMADYIKAIEIDEKCGSAYSGLGWLALYAARGSDDVSKSRELAEKARKLFFSSMGADGENVLNYGALQGLAAVMEFQGEPEEEFMPALEKAIELSPQFPHAYVQRAMVKLKRDNPPLDEIIQDYARAIAFSRDFSKVSRTWLEKLRDLLEAYCEEDE